MGRILELDGLRGAAILLVVFGTISESVMVHSLFPFERLSSDELASIFFFVLSGYLITTILWSTGNRRSIFPPSTAAAAFGFLPIYFVMLAIYLIGRQLGGSAPFCSAVHALVVLRHRTSKFLDGSRAELRLRLGLPSHGRSPSRSSSI